MRHPCPRRTRDETRRSPEGQKRSEHEARGDGQVDVRACVGVRCEARLTDLVDLEVSKVLEVNQPVGTEPSASDVTLDDERSLALLSGGILDPAERTLVDDPRSALTPRDILRDALAQMTERHRRVGRDGGIVDTLLGGEEVADEREQRLESRGRRRRGRRCGLRGLERRYETAKSHVSSRPKKATNAVGPGSKARLTWTTATTSPTP